MSREPITLPWDNPRDIAVNSLILFAQTGQGIQETLDERFKDQELDIRWRRLASELAYGSCRHRITLDTLIKQHSQRRFPKIDTLLLQILRVGLYQMLYLDRTPDFAVVHQAVEQAKTHGPRGGAKFVNAILRGVQREIAGMVTQETAKRLRAILWRDEQHGIEFANEFLPDPNKQKAKYYSIAYGHPLWLIERWMKRYDEATLQRILGANNTRPRLCLRVNRLRCDPETLAQHLSDSGYENEIWHDAVLLKQSASPEQLPGYVEGWFFVQDVAAISAGWKTAVQTGERVLDLCAAPGGKSTHMAELMKNEGEIVACDVSRAKLAKIEANCQRLGISIVRTCLAEAAEFSAAQSGLYDAVLVDAPCSNTGVLARRVEVRHRLKPADLQSLKKIQAALLHQGAQRVRNGGRLIYSTCSIEPGENEELVQKFLADHPAYEILDQQLHLPGANARATEGDAILIHSDGGFVAVLRRSE
jgi:16S rRNA (cytosine967-C5)-methyltransferase